MMPACAKTNSDIRRDYVEEKEYLSQISAHEFWLDIIHTKATPIKQSSTPNPLTIFTRTKHLSEYARKAMEIIALFTPSSSGPRSGIAMLLSAARNG